MTLPAQTLPELTWGRGPGQQGSSSILQWLCLPPDFGCAPVLPGTISKPALVHRSEYKWAACVSVPLCPGQESVFPFLSVFQKVG